MQEITASSEQIVEALHRLRVGMAQVSNAVKPRIWLEFSEYGNLVLHLTWHDLVSTYSNMLLAESWSEIPALVDRLLSEHRTWHRQRAKRLKVPGNRDS